MLDQQTTNTLIRAAKSGDNSAKETLLAENTNLIKSIVKRYLNKGVDYDDLFQLASMGLLKAINGFDEGFGVRFSTYAAYSLSNGTQPTVKVIAEQFKMPQSEVVFTMGSTHMPVSIYAQGDYKDEKSQYLLDRLPQEDKQDDMLDVMELRSAISTLPERDKKIIMLRYFRDMTQAEVAAMLGVSQVQVSRIENKIMQSFRNKLTG